MKVYDLKNLHVHERGTTLVEVVVVILISSIAIYGLVTVYANGMELVDRGAEQIAMYSEAAAAITIINDAFATADYITTLRPMNQPSPYLYVRGYATDGSGFAVREFFLYSQDNSFRWNDLSEDVGRFNQRLIPLFDYSNGPLDQPYITVENLTFTPVDPVAPRNPTTSGFAAIRMDMKLRDANGDSVMVSRVMAKRNEKSS